jgi:DNA-binding transcriptional MerR regulator
MEYRVEELAAEASLRVDTVRFYQARGLLPPPARSGRVALYSDHHLERLRRIRDLKDKGFSLETIRRLLSGGFAPADQALIAALAGPLPGEESPDEPDEPVTLEELAGRSGFSLVLLEALRSEGLLVPRPGRGPEGEELFSRADIVAAEAGLALLEAGLPLGELLDLAREHDRSVRRTAERAVELFERYVRGPIRESASSEEEAAARLVEAFRTLLPATTSLVTHHFRRVLLTAAAERIEQAGLAAEIEALEEASAPAEAAQGS